MIVNLIISPDCKPHRFFGIRIISFLGEEKMVYGYRLSPLRAGILNSKTAFPTKQTRMLNYYEEALKFCASQGWEIESQVIEQPITWDKLDELLG